MKIDVNGTWIDLDKIGINFIPNVEQLETLNKLAKFMEDKDSISTVLSGGAGTGKTSIVKIFLEYVRIKHGSYIKLVAPTHKAKAVLSRLSAIDIATTIHKLLGLKPDMSILQFDARDIQFLDSLGLFDTTHKDLIIVDECSMINNILFDMLIDKMKKKGKILFIGDAKQIAPVKQADISKVFTATDYPGCFLNKVERQQNSPLLKTLVRLRTRDVVEYQTEISQDKGIIVHDMDSFKEALSEAFFSLEVLNKAPQGNKILAYTNARVDAYNAFVRRLMGINNVAINVGEVMLAFDSYTKGAYSGYEEILHNGSEYIVTDLKKSQKLLPGYGSFPGYNLTMQDVHGDKDLRMFLIDPEESDIKYKNLGIVLEGLRIKAVKRKYLWKNYYALTESFITMKEICFNNRVIKKKTIDYGYALTAHKSQASTFTNVFVDIDNIHTCRDAEVRRQLEYVSLSRPTHIAHILQK